MTRFQVATLVSFASAAWLCAANWTRPGGTGPAYYPPVEATQIQTDERSVQAMHPVLEYGRFGEWDSTQNYGCTVLVVDDEIVLYYLGADWGHGHRHQLQTLRAAAIEPTLAKLLGEK